MHPALRFLVLAAAILAAGCQNSRGGAALESRISRSFTKLWKGSSDLLGAEARRSTHMVERVGQVGFAPRHRLNQVLATGRRAGIKASARAQRIPANAEKLVGKMGSDIQGSRRNLTRYASEFRIGPMFARWRDETIKTLESLDFSVPILAAPGDPHLSGDPNVVTRPSWIERLLTRF